MRRELVEAVAAAAYEALLVFQRANATRNAPHWERLLESERDTWRAIARRVAAGGGARDVHEDWRKRLEGDGWRKGDWDPDRKLHPSLCDWEELPPVERRKGTLVVETARAMVQAFPLSHLVDGSPGIKALRPRTMPPAKAQPRRP